MSSACFPLEQTAAEGAEQAGSTSAFRAVMANGRLPARRMIAFPVAIAALNDLTI
jgi:hypothetical protein